MRAILPIFVALAWLWLSAGACGQTLPSASPPNAAAQPATTPQAVSGDQLLAHVGAVLANQPSVAAKVRQRVDLLGHAIMGSGIYLQQGRADDWRMRFDVTLQTAGEPSLLQHVYDGRNLWLFRQVGDRKELAQVDLLRLAHARSKTGLPQPPNPQLHFTLGGLPKLVASLSESFQFGPAQRSQLDKLPVWAIEGEWKSATLARLLPDQKGAIESGSQPTLKPNMPNRAVVYVGSDDWFPYRFEFWRRTSGATADDGGRLLMVMELYEVRLGGSVDERHFNFQPIEGLDPADRTPEFLERFGLEETLPAGATRPRGPARR